MERRPFLAAGGASVLALTTSLRSSTAAPGSDGPVDVVTEYYRRASAAETTSAFAEQIPELAHSVSPLPGVLWLIGSFAIGAVAFSPLNGAVLAFVTAFGFWAVLRIRDPYD